MYPLEVQAEPLVLATTTVEVVVPTTPIIEVKQPVKRTSLEVRLMVQEAFPNDPLMWKIITCESGNRQFNKDGSVLKSPTSDYGVSQINKIHIPEAKKLGIDIMTLEGNLEFAQVLYKRSGRTPWVCARMI